MYAAFDNGKFLTQMWSHYIMCIVYRIMPNAWNWILTTITLMMNESNNKFYYHWYTNEMTMIASTHTRIYLKS